MLCVLIPPQMYDLGIFPPILWAFMRSLDFNID